MGLWSAAHFVVGNPNCSSHDRFTPGNSESATDCTFVNSMLTRNGQNFLNARSLRSGYMCLRDSLLGQLYA